MAICASMKYSLDIDLVKRKNHTGLYLKLLTRNDKQQKIIYLARLLKIGNRRWQFVKWFSIVDSPYYNRKNRKIFRTRTEAFNYAIKFLEREEGE